MACNLFPKGPHMSLHQPFDQLAYVEPPSLTLRTCGHKSAYASSRVHENMLYVCVHTCTTTSIFNVILYTYMCAHTSLCVLCSVRQGSDGGTSIETCRRAPDAMAAAEPAAALVVKALPRPDFADAAGDTFRDGGIDIDMDADVDITTKLDIDTATGIDTYIHTYLCR